jgi:hypothetical protein
LAASMCSAGTLMSPGSRVRGGVLRGRGGVVAGRTDRPPGR